MADNKHALTRYQTLDRCFRNPGRKYFIENLLDEVNAVLCDINIKSNGIKLRQLRDDIKFMRSDAGYQAPIETLFEGKKAYYRYSDTSFSITNQPLNTKEAQQLNEALSILSRFKGLPQFDWIEEMNVRLEQSFHLKNEKKAIEFDENIYLKGREYLSQLYNVIVNHQTIKVQYTTFKDLTLDIVLSPYYLKEFNNRWFLFAFRHDNNMLMTLALDRIDSIHKTKTEFIPNIEFDFEEYFEDVIGVTIIPGIEPEKITLKIDFDLWPYIKTKPIHGSQKVVETNEQYTAIQLELIPNYELEARILSFGEQIEVIEPNGFRAKIINRVNDLNKKYF